MRALLKESFISSTIAVTTTYIISKRLFLQCFFCVYLSLRLEGIRVVFLISSFKFKVQEKWLKLTGDGTQVNMTLVMELINKINLPQSGPALQGCTVNVP